MLNIISLGAGVQSTTVALMAELGEIGPKPDCAIFADVAAEPKAVYAHLAWLRSQLSFPVHDVRKNGGITEMLERSERFAGPPFFTMGKDGRAARVDALIRNRSQRGVRGKIYAHRSLMPLDQVDLSTQEERGQLNMFSHVCEGMCGS